MVWFKQGTYSLSGTVSVGTENLTIVIEDGATVELADDATPTTLMDVQGDEHDLLLYNNGYDRVDLICRGELDGNPTSHTTPKAFYWGSSHGSTLDGQGGEILGGVGFLTDCDSGTVKNWLSTYAGVSQATIGAEGCRGTTFKNIKKDASDGEALDLNAANEYCKVDTVIGMECNEVLDIDARKTEIHNVIGRNVSKLVDISGGGGNGRFSSRYIENGDGITVDGIKGDCGGNAIFVNDTNNNTVQDLKLLGIDIEQTESTNDVRTIDINSAHTDMCNGLKIEGAVSHQSTGKAAVQLRGSGLSSGLTLDLDITAPNQSGISIESFENIRGSVYVHDCGADGFLTTQRVSNLDITLHTMNNGGDGTQLNGSDLQISGAAYGNGGTDLLLQANASSPVRLDMRYGSFFDGGSVAVEASYS